MSKPYTMHNVRFGVPYPKKDISLGGISRVQCPECDMWITEVDRKDFESFSGKEYAEHFMNQHVTWPLDDGTEVVAYMHGLQIAHAKVVSLGYVFPRGWVVNLDNGWVGIAIEDVFPAPKRQRVSAHLKDGTTVQLGEVETVHVWNERFFPEVVVGTEGRVESKLVAEFGGECNPRTTVH